MMFVVGMFEDSKKWVQCLVLFFVSVLSVCLATALLMIIAQASGIPMDVLNENVRWLEFNQFMMSVVVFLFGAYMSAMLLSRHPMDFLQCHKTHSLKPYVLAFFIIIVMQPMVDWLANVNSAMQLPAFMADLQALMEQMESEAADLTKLFMDGSGTGSFIKSLILLALVPAVCEEFFFRGAVLSLCRRVFKSKHWAVWICAAIFSFIHFQFFGFLPRMLIGAILGYMVVWTNSIWVPITAHFVNNALSVMAFKLMPEVADNDLQSVMSNWEYYLTLAVSILLFAICMGLMKKNK